MRQIAILLLVLGMTGCGQISEPEAAAKINWLRDFESAKTIAQQDAKPLLIDFYTDWCGWCKKLDKDTYADDRVAEKAREFVCVKINADKQPALTKQFKVRGFPSTVFLKADGALIEVVPGYLPPEGFLDLMKKILAKVGS